MVEEPALIILVNELGHYRVFSPFDIEIVPFLLIFKLIILGVSLGMVLLFVVVIWYDMVSSLSTS